MVLDCSINLSIREKHEAIQVEGTCGHCYGLLAASVHAGRLQNAVAPADRPAVIVQGRTYTPQSILTRNMGTPEDQTTAFTPHKIIDNIYYVGTRTLSSFLVVTPQGNILINSTYERNVPTIEKSVNQLGFKFSDIKILLGSHAHGDHQEGDALVEQRTGAQILAMAEDVPALRAMRPGGKEHPIDKVLRDGEHVILGGSTLVAHLTPGHTRGCTTWTTRAQEGGKTYDVVINCSLRPPAMLTPAIIEEFNRSFKLVRSLPCDACRVPAQRHCFRNCSRSSWVIRQQRFYPLLRRRRPRDRPARRPRDDAEINPTRKTTAVHDRCRSFCLLLAAVIRENCSSLNSPAATLRLLRAVNSRRT